MTFHKYSPATSSSLIPFFTFSLMYAFAFS